MLFHRRFFFLTAKYFISAEKHPFVSSITMHKQNFNNVWPKNNAIVTIKTNSTVSSARLECYLTVFFFISHSLWLAISLVILFVSGGVYFCTLFLCLNVLSFIRFLARFVCVFVCPVPTFKMRWFHKTLVERRWHENMTHGSIFRLFLC